MIISGGSWHWKCSPFATLTKNIVTYQSISHAQTLSRAANTTHFDSHYWEEKKKIKKTFIKNLT